MDHNKNKTEKFILREIQIKNFDGIIGSFLVKSHLKSFDLPLVLDSYKTFILKYFSDLSHASILIREFSKNIIVIRNKKDFQNLYNKQKQIKKIHINTEKNDMEVYF